MSRRRFRFAAAVAAILTAGAIGPPQSVAQTLDEATTIAPGIETPAFSDDCYLGDVTPASHLTGDGTSGGGRSCDRWYLGLSGGWQERETAHEVGDPSTFIDFDSGFAINAQLGYRFDVFRVESEFTVMNNDVLRAGSGGNASRSDGNVNLRAFMFNIYHDFNLFDWLWEPYVGAGIGIYQSDINGLYPDFFDAIPPQFGFQGAPINATSDFPLAYQFRAGMSRPVGRRTDAVIGYRYFKGEELEFASAPFASPSAHTFHPNGASIHSLELGLRVRF
jgi:opacity protein-like surface antigen